MEQEQGVAAHREEFAGISRVKTLETPLLACGAGRGKP